MADAKQEPQAPEAPQQHISEDVLRGFATDFGMNILFVREANSRLDVLTALTVEQAAEIVALKERIAELEKASETAKTAEQARIAEARIKGVAAEIADRKPKAESKAA